MDKDTEKQIEKIFKLFSEIFTAIIELMKMEKKFWNQDMLDEQFYLTDLRREILWIIDQIVNILDNKIKDLEQAKDNIEKVGRPLETIRINKLKDDVILMKEQLENMRIQFN